MQENIKNNDLCGKCKYLKIVKIENGYNMTKYIKNFCSQIPNMTSQDLEYVQKCSEFEEKRVL